MGLLANIAARRRGNCCCQQHTHSSDDSTAVQPTIRYRAQRQDVSRPGAQQKSLEPLSVPEFQQTAPAPANQAAPETSGADAEPAGAGSASNSTAAQPERQGEQRFIKTSTWVASGDGPPYVLSYQQTLRAVGPQNPLWCTAEPAGISFTAEDLKGAKDENGYKLMSKAGTWYAVQLKNENGKQEIAKVNIFAVSEKQTAQPQPCRLGARSGNYLALREEWIALPTDSCRIDIAPSAADNAAPTPKPDVEPRATLPAPAQQAKIASPHDSGRAEAKPEADAAASLPAREGKAPVPSKQSEPPAQTQTAPVRQTEARFLRSAAWVAEGEKPPYSLSYQQTLQQARPGDSAWAAAESPNSNFTAADLQHAAKEMNGYKIVFKGGAWYALKLKDQDGKQQIETAKIYAVSAEQQQQALSCRYRGQTGEYLALRPTWIELPPGSCTLTAEQAASEPKAPVKPQQRSAAPDSGATSAGGQPEQRSGSKKFKFPKVDLGLGTVVQEEQSHLPPNAWQVRAQEAEKRADQIEATGRNAAEAPAVQSMMAQGGRSTAYRRFLTAYSPYLPHSLPSRDAIIERTGLPPGMWAGSRSVIKPKDPDRPGIIMATDTDHAEAINNVVTKLREATTKTLVKQLRFLELDTTRANAVLLARQGSLLEEGLAEANKALAKLPHIVAANSVLEAVNRTGRMAAVERGAQGRFFARRRFNNGLAEGYSRAAQAGREAQAELTELVVQRCKAFAYGGAGEMENEARRVGKKLDLIGFEIDFNNRSKTGIDYFVKIKDGGYQILHNIGENFADKNASVLPPEVYGPFNVDILTHYQKNGAITEAELPLITLKHGILPTKEGEMTYLDPKLYSSDAIAAAKSAMDAVYKTNRYPSRQEVQDALSAAAQTYARK